MFFERPCPLKKPILKHHRSNCIRAGCECCHFLDLLTVDMLFKKSESKGNFSFITRIDEGRDCRHILRGSIGVALHTEKGDTMVPTDK